MSQTKHPIPDEATKNVLAIVGKTGSGKTYTAKGALERVLALGARVCVLDPTGAWWGLRSSADGEHDGFPVVVFGGDHADVPLEETTGVALGELIAVEAMQCVVDLSAMTMGGRVRFVTAFLEALYAKNRSPLYLVLDEADLFAPQRPLPDQTVMLNRVEQIVRRGRIKGFRPWVITQRPAELHKSVLSQAGTLVAMKLTAPQDRDAIGAWIEGQADRDQGKKLLADLPKLKTGEGYVWSPATDLLAKARFPAIKTFDSSRTPEDGEELAEPTRLAAVDLSAIRKRLVVETKAATDADPKALRKRIADLESQTAARPAGVDPAQLAAEHTRGIVEGRLEMAREFGSAIAVVLERFRAATPAATPPAPPTIPAIVRSAATGGGSGGAELRVLRVLAQRHPARFTMPQWATLAGMKRTGGTWQTYVSRLRTSGYLDQRDGTYGVTPAGLAASGGAPAQPQTAGEVQAMWRQALGGGAAKMLDVLIEVYPHGLDRANLADRLRMVASGGTFQTYLSRLKSNGLVTIEGRKVHATDIVALGRSA